MMVYIEVRTVDPAFNLALEEYVFTQMPRNREYFLTWRNDNAIIIGRHQNTQAEINADFVREKQIKVVRRLSGGGAVYHDLGNLNFTFIADAQPGQKVDLGKFCQPIADALCSLGIKAVVDGRNDILIDGKKVSGNAQYVRQGRVMHHGTILFDSDMSVLGEALKPDPEKVRTKGVKSVRSRVTNVRSCLKEDMTLEQFRNILAKTLLSEDVLRYELTEEDVAAIEKLRTERYARQEWNYGFCQEKALVRKRHIPGCGTVAAHIVLDGEIISDIAFYGDYFSTNPTEELVDALKGAKLCASVLEEALDGCDVNSYITGLSNPNLIALLCGLPCV